MTNSEISKILSRANTIDHDTIEKAIKTDREKAVRLVSMYTGCAETEANSYVCKRIYDAYEDELDFHLSCEHKDAEAKGDYRHLDYDSNPQSTAEWHEAN
jgi:hypothetical protein